MNWLIGFTFLQSIILSIFKHQPWRLTAMGLRVIDGTPTAIAKFIREEDAKRLCPKCGSEMKLHCTEYPGWEHLYCPKCGHEEKVKE